VPDDSKVHTPVHVYGFSVWYSLHVTLLATRILRWLLGVRQICKTLINKEILMFFLFIRQTKSHNYYTFSCSIVFCKPVHFVGTHGTDEFQITRILPFLLDFHKLYIK